MSCTAAAARDALLARMRAFHAHFWIPPSETPLEARAAIRGADARRVGHAGDRVRGAAQIDYRNAKIRAVTGAVGGLSEWASVTVMETARA